MIFIKINTRFVIHSKCEYVTIRENNIFLNSLILKHK